MAIRPWYVRATDIAHRLTVLALFGGTVYLGVGIGYTAIRNSIAVRERRKLKEEQDRLEREATEAAIQQLDKSTS